MLLLSKLHSITVLEEPDLLLVKSHKAIKLKEGFNNRSRATMEESNP